MYWSEEGKIIFWSPLEPRSLYIWRPKQDVQMDFHIFLSSFLNGFRGFVRRNRLELFILRLPKVVNITFCLVAKCKFSNTTNHSIYAISVSHRWPFRCLFRLHVMTLEMVTDLWSWNSPQKLSKHSCQSKSLSMVLLILRVFCDVHFNT